MSNLLLLVTCLAIGIALRRWNRAPADAHRSLNAFLIHVALPAVTLRTLHDFRFEAEHLGPVLMPWILFAIGAGVFWSVGRWLKLSRASTGSLTLVGGLGNTSFVGLPMIESLAGRQGLGLGLLIDQMGSYLVLSTLGVFVAARYAGGLATSGRAMAIKIATFPPFIALVVALVLRPVPMPAAVDATLLRLGDTLVPLALVSVGLQLRVDALRAQAPLLSIGLGYKLLVCPALVFAVLWLTASPFDTTTRVSMIEASMPPMIGAGIVAAEAQLNAPLVSTMIGIGIPLGVLTAFAWHTLYRYVAAA